MVVYSSKIRNQGLLILLGIICGLCLDACHLKNNIFLDMPWKKNGQAMYGKLVLDQNWHWIHNKAGYTNCFDNGWSPQFCPDPNTCNANCCIEGIDSINQWRSPYGASVSNDALTLRYVTQGQYGVNVGSRVYLMNSDQQNYVGFNLLNKEFSFTVDVSQLPCGLNGALYFVEMGLNTTRQTIVNMGQGYGDAQCAHDIKSVDGIPNLKGIGACSHQMDIWQANSAANAFTAHTCTNSGVKACTTKQECGQDQYRYSGNCDMDGADFNGYRLGNKNWYGPGSQYQVDTTKPFQVITQFHTSTGTETGDLIKVTRIYKQNGKVIQGGELTESSIARNKATFNQRNRFSQLGGLKGMGKSLQRQHVLVLSLWDDDSPAMMRWLDSRYPADSQDPGALRGPCPIGNHDPAYLRKTYPNSQVIYSSIKLDSIQSYETATQTE